MLLILYTKNLEFRLEIIFIRSFILIEDLAGFVVLSTGSPYSFTAAYLFTVSYTFTLYWMERVLTWKKK